VGKAGRESGVIVGRREDEDGGTESFLPTCVYDAMKVRKRFEHMRVSFRSFSFFFRPLFSCRFSCRPFFSFLSFPFLSFPFLSFFFAFLFLQCCSVPSHLMTIPIIQGSYQDAEELFGFYLDTLEEELLATLAAVSAPSPSNPANTSSTNAAPGKHAKLGSVTGTTAATATATASAESGTVVSHEDVDGDGWLEVGKRTRTVVTRTVCFFFGFVSRFSLLLSFLPSFLSSIHPSLFPCLIPNPFTRLLIRHSPTQI
jgi:hypothetical protein